MSVRPRIFVSAVTSEFGSTRQLVANILTRLGYEPVMQLGPIGFQVQDVLKQLTGRSRATATCLNRRRLEIDLQLGTITLLLREFSGANPVASSVTSLLGVGQRLFDPVLLVLQDARHLAKLITCIRTLLNFRKSRGQTINTTEPCGMSLLR